MNEQQQPQMAPESQGGLLELGQDLSPEQVEMMKKGFQIAQQIIYDKATFDALMKEAMQGGSPAESLGGLVVQVIMKIQEHFKKVDFVVLLALGIKIIDDLASAISETGQMQLQAQDVEGAMQFAVQMWLGANQGKYDPQEVQGLMAQAGGV